MNENEDGLVKSSSFFSLNMKELKGKCKMRNEESFNKKDSERFTIQIS